MEKFVPFLKTVAEDLVEKNNDERDFSRLTIVFPNKRARLFMNKYLLDAYNRRQQNNMPLWSPDYATSSNLLEYFGRLFGIPLTVVPDVDKFQLVQLLFSVYQNQAKRKLDDYDQTEDVPRKVLTKSLDEFYFLGEIILNDFDDIDKNLVDAQRLFRNFKEWKDLDALDYLTDEQVKAIRDFLKRDFDTETALFKGFITLWELLGSIYTAFKEELEKRGLAYAGMLHRKVAERLQEQGLPELLPSDRQFAFVGFNALNGCEKQLLKKLNKRQLPDGKPAAYYYWDYDVSYFDPDNMTGPDMTRRKSFRDDAGTFLRANIGGFSAVSHTSSHEKLFLSLPNELRKSVNEVDQALGSHNYLKRLADGQHVRVRAATTDTAQTKYVGKFIADLKAQGAADDDIAIVLCDEKLLPAVLHSIPPTVERLNVTMGFPITQTPAYVLVSQLVQLQMARGKGSRFSYANVLSLLRSDVVRKWNSGLMNLLISQMRKSAQTYLGLADIVALLKSKGVEPDAETTHFIGTLFCTDFKVVNDAPADELLNWLTAVMGLLAKVYRSEAANPVTDEAEHNFGGLYEEAFFQVYRMLNCLLTAQTDENSERLSVALCSKLMNKMFASAKVPYSGEPARGLQVMGFLETRSLDFKHVLMLSVGEGFMPKASFAPSFIPYALRIGFNLPAIEHEDALYAYNFFRLLQRPASITLVFNTSSQASAGEQSRFIRQLKDEYKAFSVVKPLAFRDATTAPVVRLSVPKSDDDIAFLKARYQFMPAAERDAYNQKVAMNERGKTRIDLSPSALNCYLDCKLRFYFRYIQRLKADEDFDMDVDEAYFGLIFHKTMENIYTAIATDKSFVKPAGDWHGTVTVSDLKPYAKPNVLQTMVDQAFCEEFNVASPDDYTGIQLIKRDVLTELVRKQLEVDMDYAGENGFIIYRPEFPVSQPVEVTLASGEKFAFAIGGILDRRDLKGSVFRVVDYKTGGDADGHKHTAKSVEYMFEHGSKRSDKVFQATLYSCLWNMQTPGATRYNKDDRMVQPVLMFPRQMNKGYDPALIVGEKKEARSLVVNGKGDAGYNDVEAEFMERLDGVLRSLLDRNVPFSATDDDDSCGFCDFKAICHKEDAAR